MRVKYTDQQITDFLELAQEVGYSRAIRELKYPAYSTAIRWAEMRGVVIEVDPVMSSRRMKRSLYETEDMIAVVVEGVTRIYEELTENDSLTADDQQRLATAYAKYADKWLVLQGRANDITEKHSRDDVDLELMNLVQEHKRKSQELTGNT